MSRRKLDICFLVNELAPAGAQTLLLDIVRHTEAADVEYTVCFIEGDDTLAADFEAAGARVVDFSAEFKFDPRALLRLTRFFHRETFDIVHAHLPYAQNIGRVSATIGGGHDAIISTQHDLPERYHPITRILERITRPLDDMTIAVSQVVERSFTGSSHVYPDRRGGWTTIYNGTDVGKFEQEVTDADARDVCERYGIEDANPVFVIVGRYVDKKRHQDLIQAMATVRKTLPEAHLLIVGWGPRHEDLEECAHKHDVEDCVTITGRVESVTPYLAAADAFVLSSISESFGIVLIEAMVAKLPVIATNVQAVPEVVENGETGILVPPRSPRKLADAMMKLRDPERRKRLGEAGYKKVQNEFSIGQVVDDHLEMYRKNATIE